MFLSIAYFPYASNIFKAVLQQQYLISYLAPPTIQCTLFVYITTHITFRPPFIINVSPFFLVAFHFYLLSCPTIAHRALNSTTTTISVGKRRHQQGTFTIYFHYFHLRTSSTSPPDAVFLTSLFSMSHPLFTT